MCRRVKECVPAVLWISWMSLVPLSGVSAVEPYAIEVVDAATGRGVPLVELTTTSNVRLYTDSNGIAAFAEPSCMGRKVFFHVKSHGYEYRKDGFGFRGIALDVEPGGQGTIKLSRVNVAERLYRVTGAGIYRDSRLVGRRVPLAKPLLNALVVGSDSVITAVYRGKMYWFWGDTNRLSYPLGNFHSPGAVSVLPQGGGLRPEVGVDLTYFRDDAEFARPTAKLPGKGPTWLSGLVVLRDRENGERMFAHYVKIRSTPGGGFHPYERGLCEWDDRERRFRKVAAFPSPHPFPSGGHTLVRSSRERSYVYYCDPYPYIRVAADPEALRDQQRYEVLTCRAPGDASAGGAPAVTKIDRSEDGTVRYRWRSGVALPRAREQTNDVQAGGVPGTAGRLRPDENIYRLRDVESGRAVLTHRGTIYWNAYRRRWVMIAGEHLDLGEIWYSEADHHLGPWGYARKVVTHERYSFYNPKHHPEFDGEGGRWVFFEGTYTAAFSGNPVKTPRYDYNQIMYRLDLNDPRLNLPVAVYESADPERLFALAPGNGERARGRIAFWALEREAPGTVSVFLNRADGHPSIQVGGESAKGKRARPFIYVVPPKAKPESAVLVPLYRYPGAGGRAHYRAGDDARLTQEIKERASTVAFVWGHSLRGIPWRAFPD